MQRNTYPYLSSLLISFSLLMMANLTIAFAQVVTAKVAVREERYPQPEMSFAGGVFGSLLSSVQGQKKTSTDWPTFGNDAGGQRYSH